MAILKKIYYFFSAREKAAMLNDDGEVIAYAKILEKSNTFDFNDGKYVVRRNLIKPLKSKSFMFDHHLYFYNIGNPEPLNFKKGNTKGWEPLIEPDLLNRLLEAEIIKKLNTVDEGMFKNIKPIHVIIGIVIIAAIVYYVTSTPAAVVAP